jgi:hypothetical protein
VKVRHHEGVANRIGPEPCVFTREGEGEASTGEPTGQPLRREITLLTGADAFAKAEGNTLGCENASVPTARRGRRTWHVGTLVEREPGDPVSGQQKSMLVRTVKARSRNR